MTQRLYRLGRVGLLVSGLLLPALALWPAALAAGPADAVVKLRVAPPGASPRTGSGFVVGRDADWLYVLTAAHVVDGVAEAGVVFGHRPQARARPARVLYPQYWDARGLALLRMAADDPPAGLAPPLSLADGGRVPRGAELTVIGHPPRLGDWSVLRGVLANRQGETLKVQVPVDEGNSGGPVLLDGRVVGMVVAEERGIAIVKSVVNLRNYLDGYGLLALQAADADADAEPGLGHAAGDTFRDCDGCPEMVVIPAGEFRMGSPDTEANRAADEGPVHRVRIARDFALGKHEVTVAEFRAFVEAEGYRTEAERGDGCVGGTNWLEPGFAQEDDQPVVCVSWNDAQAYVNWLGQRTGAGYRLPSEAEWEYAARAGTATPFWTGDCIHTDQANYDGNYDYDGCGAKTGVYRQRTVAAGSLPANAFGLHEVAGNVYEWVEDCRHDDYTGAPGDGSAWLQDDGGECARRVLRGGSWFNYPRNLRAADRVRLTRDGRNNSVGFRLARTL